MAVPQLGKCIVLSVLVLLFYVGSGFRIRDTGQTSSLEQITSCTTSTRDKCPSEITPTSSPNLPNKRIKNIEKSQNRFLNDESRQPPVVTEGDIHQNRASQIRKFIKKDVWKKVENEKLKNTNDDKKSNGDKESNEVTVDDDSDEAVVEIESDDDDDDVSNDFVGNLDILKKNEVKRDGKWSLKSQQKILKEPDNDENENLQESSINKRIDAKTLSKGNSEDKRSVRDGVEKNLNYSGEDGLVSDDIDSTDDEDDDENVTEELNISEEEEEDNEDEDDDDDDDDDDEEEEDEDEGDDDEKTQEESKENKLEEEKKEKDDRTDEDNSKELEENSIHEKLDDKKKLEEKKMNVTPSQSKEAKIDKNIKELIEPVKIEVPDQQESIKIPVIENVKKVEEVKIVEKVLEPVKEKKINENNIKEKKKAKKVEEKVEKKVEKKNEEKGGEKKVEKKIEAKVEKKTEKKIEKDVEKKVEPKMDKKKVEESKKIEKKEKKSESKQKKINTVKKQKNMSISLGDLNELILQVPNFVPNYTKSEDSICQQHGKIFLRQLRGHKLWALQMLDASAKIPSGLLRGNVNQLGDFDQCLGISARVKVDSKKTIKIQGKYCLGSIDFYPVLPDTKVPANLMQSRGFLRGNMRDTSHFVPRFTTVNWAICMPHSCSAEEAKKAIESSLERLNVTTGIKFNVDVDQNMCYVQQKSTSYSKETIGVLYFYAMIVCLVIVATLRDYIVVSEKPNYSERIIMSFSLRRTIKSLTKPNKQDSNEITCIHGIRTLATMMLYVAHKMIPIASTPYANRIVWTEVANNPISSLLRVSLVYTDSFLLLSGVLTAFNMASESKKRGEIRWFCRFIARFIRLTPALLVVIFWYAFVMEHTGSGPQWNNIIKANADLCKKNAWTNLLYIQNFFPFEEMCATHTHQLALDMQLSILSPLLVFFLQIKPIIGILLIFFLLQVSATIRYFATVNNYLSLVIFHGMTAKHLYKTANLTYAVSIHRATPYLFGVGLGVLLNYTGKNIKIYKIFVALGWISATALGAWSLFSPWRMARRDYVYDPEDAANYAVLGPVSWSLSICWIIFACFTDHGGIINKFLSNYWFLLFSRISYSVYLTQFAVFFYNLATTKYTSEFQVLRVIDPYEAIMVTLTSVVLTLFFDIPMQEVKNVLMESTDVPLSQRISNLKKSKEQNTDDKQEELPRSSNNQPEFSQRKLSGRQKYFVKQDVYDDFEREKRRSRSRSVQRNFYIDRDKEMTPSRYQEQLRRDRRSSSRPLTSKIKTNYEPEESRLTRRDRSSSRMSEPRLSRRSESKTREKSPRIRKTPVRLLSSGSEDEQILVREKSPRRLVEKPRVSDEEDWEQELRIRRKKYQEKLASDERENDSRDLSRRSSAEGKIALLTEPTGSRVMEAWTISKGPRISLESSQGPTDTEEENRYYRDFDDDKPREEKIEEINDEFNEPIDNFVIKRPHKTRTLMDLRQITNEEQEITPIATGKLFKRESIIKSQASEEDPEYLLPERPKLVEQEQEHPFRKAWQMQKSRSEEDGPAAFAIKDPKPQSEQSRSDNKSPSPPKIDPPVDQTFHFIVEDVDSKIRKTISEESRSTSNVSSEEPETSAESSRIYSDDMTRTNRSTNGMEHEWHSEDEQFGRRRLQRRGSQTWQWESDET